MDDDRINENGLRVMLFSAALGPLLLTMVLLIVT
jgi:hypothetical protein